MCIAAMALLRSHASSDAQTVRRVCCTVCGGASDLPVYAHSGVVRSRFWDGIFVLYDYTAPRKASQAVQKYLSTPVVGSEMNILRCSLCDRRRHVLIAVL